MEGFLHNKFAKPPIKDSRLICKVDPLQVDRKIKKKKTHQLQF